MLHIPRSPEKLLFAEIVPKEGDCRIHIGCVMAAGYDWVEVSVPETIGLPSSMRVRFLPSAVDHTVKAVWRTTDRVGFAYLSGGPGVDHFAGYRGLMDPRTAAMVMREGRS